MLDRVAVAAVIVAAVLILSAAIHAKAVVAAARSAVPTPVPLSQPLPDWDDCAPYAAMDNRCLNRNT